MAEKTEVMPTRNENSTYRPKAGRPKRKPHATLKSTVPNTIPIDRVIGTGRKLLHRILHLKGESLEPELPATQNELGIQLLVLNTVGKNLVAEVVDRRDYTVS